MAWHAWTPRGRTSSPVPFVPFVAPLFALFVTPARALPLFLAASLLSALITAVRASWLHRISVSVDPWGVLVGDVLTVPAVAIDAILGPDPVLERDGSTYGHYAYRVVVHAWGQSLPLVFERRRDASAFVEAVRAVIPPTERARFAAPHHPVAKTLAAACCAAAAALALSAHLAWALLLFAGAVLLFAGASTPSEVRVTDGVLAWKALRGLRWVPLAEVTRWTVIRDEAAHRRVLRVRLRDGRRLELGEVLEDFSHPSDRSSVDTLRTALEKVVPTRSWAETAPYVSALRRGGRSVHGWIDALLRAAPQGGYRDAALDDDVLVRIVEDDAAPDDARVGAAFLLARRGDEPMRARIAEVSATAVGPTRDALRAIADNTSDLEKRLRHVGED